MRTLSAPLIAALAAPEVAVATLVRMVFPSGTIGLNSSQYTFTWSGVTYLAAAGLGQVSVVTDSPSEVAPGIRLELIVTDDSHLALALDDADQVQGAVVTISTAVLDRVTHQVIDVMTDWTGYADTMEISEDSVIVVTAESKGVDLLRGSPLVYSDGDQQSLVPGDRYFQYVVSQSDQSVVWPTKEFFQK
jgi:hypothetical protein